MNALADTGRSTLSKTFRVFGALIAVLLAGALFYVQSGLGETQPTLNCAFTQPPGTTALRTPNNSGNVENLRLEGGIGDKGNDGMGRFSGTASWVTDGQPRQGEATGPIFLAEDGAVEGLMLTVRHPSFRSGGLRIVTLNREGMLDQDRSRAFLSFEPAQKRVHPVNYACGTQAR